MRDCLKLIVGGLDGAKVVGEVAGPLDLVPEAFRTRPQIILMDLAGPASLQVLRDVSATLPEARVICLADAPSDQLVQAAVAAGANGIALKSDSPDQLFNAFEGARDGRRTLTAGLAAPILQHYLEILNRKRVTDAAIIETLAAAVDAKDASTGRHIQRVGHLAASLATYIDPALENNDDMRYGFVLHDVGKIGIPEAILLKESPLDEEEWAIMRTHPLIGVNIIAPLGLGDEAGQVVRHHHERWDGGGYPDRLDRYDIPLAARIFTVADTFDAMTNDRPYRQGLSIDEALREIGLKAKSQFDPGITEGFIDLVSDGMLEATAAALEATA
jgi:HD-GYP domain-containing protein (c-di-GMP phosphodiesterase class II)